MDPAPLIVNTTQANDQRLRDEALRDRVDGQPEAVESVRTERR